MSEPKHPRRSTASRGGLGTLGTEGKQLAAYRWQVPKDTAARDKIVAILDQIAAAATKQGRQEMPRICAELKTAAKASPSPQQVDALVSGFDRLMSLWQAAQPGLL